MDRRVTTYLIAYSCVIMILLIPQTAFCGYVRIPNFLLELGIKYYQEGDYLNALHEFNKLLIVSPEGKEADAARKYISLIEQALAKKDLRRQAAVKLTLEKIEGKIRKKEPIPELIEEEVSEEAVLEEVVKERLVLDQSVWATQPGTKLELELNQTVTTEGQDITRWLATSPENLIIERIDGDQVKITAQRIGRTFLHIWDRQGRWTLNVQVIPPRYIQRLAQEYKERLEQVEPFKVRYSFSRSSYHLGRKVDDTARQNLTFDQWIGVDGQTPYGNFDTVAQISKLSETTDLTHFTIGLTDGSLGGLDEFDLRGFDFSANFSNLCFPGESLRGVRFDKRALLDDRLDYTAIWGRESQGKFGRLSPGLADVRDAFIYGGQLDYAPNEDLHWRLASAWGYGNEREEDLKDNVVDLAVDYQLKEGLSLGGEIAYDSDQIALLLNSGLVAPKLTMSAEFRDLEKGFYTITGRPSRSGEIGGVLGANYTPVKWLNLAGDMDVYKDRLFANPDNPDRLNLDLRTESQLFIDPTTTMRMNYHHIDERGKLSPRQADNYGLGINKRFPQLRNLSTYLHYKHLESESPNTPTMDYSRNSVICGLSLRIIDNLSYYASQEYSWLSEEFTDEKTNPSVFRTGLDYYKQLFDWPVYTTWRIDYRDEEETTAAHSFLAGEDGIELFGEIAFRPTADFELFASSRLKNSWADDPEAEGGVEIDVRAGGRLIWDTAFSWNPVCSVTGLVYKDLNDDGQKQDDEPGVENIKVFVGKEYTVTDADGFYFFEQIRGVKANVGIDPASLPTGFVIRGADLQQIQIKHGQTILVDFPIASRSEIYGVVFEDVNGDNRYGINDRGVEDVVLTLEDGRKAITDSKGQYYFRRVAVGEHTITLDINSLPLDYLPQVPLSKKITLFEGLTYLHNIPLKRAK